MEETYNRRGKSRNKNKMRNLAQFRDMSDEEFDKLMEEKETVIATSRDLEKKIEEKVAQFSQDYDISDLKINDREILRGLMQAIISLEAYEQFLFKLRADGVNPDNIIVIEKLQKVVSDIRKSISDYQNDLAITRKSRKSDQQTSVVAYIDDLKEKAREFIESRHSFIFCPKCNTLLGTIWTLYPRNEENKVLLYCEHDLGEGKICGAKIVVSTKELIENRGTNNRDVMPDSLV